MRIISKYRDYYDGVMAYGQDNSITWVRDTEVVETDTSRLGIADGWFNHVDLKVRGDSVTVYEFYIACAGQLYPINSGKFSGWLGKEKEYKRDLVLSGNTYQEVKESFCKLLGQALIAPREDYKPNYGWSRTAEADRQAWLEKPCHGLHILFDCPLLLIEQNKITKCPNLKAIGFQRVRDSFNIFQDISQYISGVMAQRTNPMVTITDKSKILKHGLDPKWSFRRRPEDSK